MSPRFPTTTPGRRTARAECGCALPSALARVRAFTFSTMALAAAAPVVSAPLSLQRTYFGEAPLDQFGYALHAAGDLNSDGFADFLVGANTNDSGAPGGGEVYLFRGGDEFPSSAALTCAGQVASESFGGAVCGGGDLDGDGFADWVVGAPGAGTSGSDPGRVYVFRGGASPDGAPELVVEGSVATGQFGAAVLVGPDLDGDGYGDLVVGAPRAGNGEVRIYRGGPLPLDATPDRIVHARAGDSRFGRSLAWLPDLDGDGCDELLVGVPHASQSAAWAGAVLLLRGTAMLDTIPDLVLVGQAAGDEFGTSLEAGVDLDGDGAADILAGAPAANVGAAVDAGRAYLYRGGTMLDAIADHTFDGAAADNRFGTSIASGFDWDGDGAPDLAIGAPDADANGTDSGACTIFRGGAALDGTADATVTGPAAAAHLGESVASLGDIRRNGRGALLVGGYSTTDAGRALLIASSDMPVDAVVIPPASGARLLPAWPNPCNPSMQSALRIPESGSWTVDVLDVRGRRVARLLSAWLTAGNHALHWDGRDARGAAVSSGVYCILARSAKGTCTTHVTLVR